MLIESMDLAEILSIIRQTGAFFQRNNTKLNVMEKGTADYVTEVDYSVQQYMWEKLRALSPDIQLMGEEQTSQSVDPKKPCWILDPVDGTTNLVHDFRHSSLSLALVENGSVVFGAVYHPYLNELFYALRGKGAFVNDRRLEPLASSDLRHSLVAVGTNPYCRIQAERMFQRIKNVFSKCEDIRRTGSAALDLAYVASARTGAYFEENLKPWDFAAGLLLVEEVGGTVTDFEGNTLDVFSAQSVVAGEIHTHEELLPLLH